LRTRPACHGTITSLNSGASGEIKGKMTPEEIIERKKFLKMQAVELFFSEYLKIYETRRALEKELMERFSDLIKKLEANLRKIADQEQESSEARFDFGDGE
jgi:hypothetical protein